MSRVLATKTSRKRTKSISSNCSIFSMRGCVRSKRATAKNYQGSFELNFKSLSIILGSIIFVLGVFYLYQVNDLATMGYEIRDIEKEIYSLSEINKDNRIKEVELKSMYNIEKTAEDLNLVSTKEVTYLNLNEEVAMK